MGKAEITLPWPPSVNAYWRSPHPGAVLVSRAGRVYRGAVLGALMEQRIKSLGAARLGVHITARPPDRRRRDLDNLLKATLDSLQHGGLFDDDSQIDMLSIVRSTITPGGSLILTVYPIKDE